ncbi:MAG TPA: glutamine amidotransferase [Polyangiaceae bacterium LLY-WYZ-15_(1-7)]|nr:glutamine amidotransferase [Polyangiaceae bacterium LLY-WYZ-15_(1-7)]HJL11970.1 glutamine amidotransferase [Polyangiaceae bacterium LLY-WYZ-15_(1-7)]HJL21590.1 glutamine amidotransferase [Polyangiaceae bacterium LLY-WYZ-15_(1-7)]HJL34875.1 glutamine amidotransferase [Polyangiaceae bacterium LLY-WYZ-15_(1-7)]HJL47454.1 glutamine amidotransferase [Polyangiaceae bacterium LLY-WYZ-15_(1-7)]
MEPARDRLLIVKVGGSRPAMRAARGDYEDWFRAGLGLSPERAPALDVRDGTALPAPAGWGGVLVTGSAAMVTDRAEWSVRTAAWLPEVLRADVPLLGICYGHQLLADAMGGLAGDNPRGRQLGTVAVRRLPGEDPLLDVVPRTFRVQATHSQSVLRLPEGAVRLAETDLDPNHAYRLGERAWGLQFHPEMDADILKRLVAQWDAPLRAEGRAPEAIVAGLEDTAHGTTILRRFVELAGLGGR